MEPKRLITVFITVHHLSLSCAILILFPPPLQQRQKDQHLARDVTLDLNKSDFNFDCNNLSSVRQYYIPSFSNFRVKIRLPAVKWEPLSRIKRFQTKNWRRITEVKHEKNLPG